MLALVLQYSFIIVAVKTVVLCDSHHLQLLRQGDVLQLLSTEQFGSCYDFGEGVHGLDGGELGLGAQLAEDEVGGVKFGVLSVSGIEGDSSVEQLLQLLELRLVRTVG